MRDRIHNNEQSKTYRAGLALRVERSLSLASTPKGERSNARLKMYSSELSYHGSGVSKLQQNLHESNVLASGPESGVPIGLYL